MGRYTIRSRRATIARRDVRTYRLTRAESWRVDCDAARLDRGRPVHRDRVRFGAWEARPLAVLVTGAHRDPGGWTMPDGRRLECVHPRGFCQPGPCVIHNPLSTHMDSWPLYWRDDRGIFERICPHGVGHPAPEQAAHIGPGGMVHGCCGCCSLGAAEARSGDGVGMGEGPADSGGSQTYKCSVCRDRECGGYECEVDA